MLSFHPLDLATDREFFLDLHCLGNYESDEPWFRGDNFEAYRSTWLATAQVDGSIAHLAQRLADPRTIAEVWEEDGQRVGLLIVSFSEIEGYGFTVAVVDDIAVLPELQRRGIGTRMLSHAEELAREKRADLFRSETGAWNEASQALHRKLGFEVFRLQYEKRLT